MEWVREERKEREAIMEWVREERKEMDTKSGAAESSVDMTRIPYKWSVQAKHERFTYGTSRISKIECARNRGQVINFLIHRNPPHTERSRARANLYDKIL
ncbi:hypothetical protein RRG08_017214 [Elysia crispata]|uniref:Uncharacterized protein n=1 Tax=Elysia crispata TaxID=231223 RepID=A0AAE0ZUQ7_9GAST|nr:hypothetical protein RRG08_017214 [Elysia crispata]